MILFLLGVSVMFNVILLGMFYGCFREQQHMERVVRQARALSDAAIDALEMQTAAIDATLEKQNVVPFERRVH